MFDSTIFTSKVIDTFRFLVSWSGREIGNDPPGIEDVFTVLKTSFNGLAFTLAPIVIVLMFIYGGLQRMLGGDNPQNVAKSTAVITWAILGTFVLLLSFILINIIAYLAGTNLRI